MGIFLELLVLSCSLLVIFGFVGTLSVFLNAKHAKFRESNENQNGISYFSRKVSVFRVKKPIFKKRQSGIKNHQSAIKHNSSD